MNQFTLMLIEKNADKIGRGSIFRACLAIKRSCKDNPKFGEKVLNLGIEYCLGTKDLTELINISNNNTEHEGILKESFHALQNAIYF